jgi:hypothetical protein
MARRAYTRRLKSGKSVAVRASGLTTYRSSTPFTTGGPKFSKHLRSLSAAELQWHIDSLKGWEKAGYSEDYAKRVAREGNRRASIRRRGG